MEKILKDYANNEFKEFIIRKPYQIQEFAQTAKPRYYYFHKSHGHNSNEYVHLKKIIEEQIKKGIIIRYT